MPRHLVLTADQRHSRAHADHVDAALHQLADIPTLLAFERTTGDEIQGVLADPSGLVEAVTALTRLDLALPPEARPGWHLGIGVGDVDDLTVSTTRAARGSAHLAARTAVEEAKTASQHLRLLCPDDPAGAQLAEDALALLRHVLGQRTATGWEATDLWRRDHNQSVVAATVGVSESAISQRLSRAGWQEEDRALRLARHHLALLYKE